MRFTSPRSSRSILKKMARPISKAVADLDRCLIVVCLDPGNVIIQLSTFSKYITVKFELRVNYL